MGNDIQAYPRHIRFYEGKEINILLQRLVYLLGLGCSYRFSHAGGVIFVKKRNSIQILLGLKPRLGSSGIEVDESNRMLPALWLSLSSRGLPPSRGFLPGGSVVTDILVRRVNLEARRIALMCHLLIYMYR